MENIVVSIVIPIYNASKYIRKCLDSIQNQTYTRLEIICVDDGSSDNSVELVNEYLNKDSRFFLIQQKNQYAGIARNNGMELTSGKYILFLDADDWFELTMVEKLVELAEKENSEIVIFGANTYDNVTNKYDSMGWILPEWIVSRKEEFKPETSKDRILTSFGNCPWNKFFLREFLQNNNIKFPNLKNGEDIYFSNLALSLAKVIGICDERFVYYRMNNSLSIEGNKVDMPFCFFESLMLLKERLIEEKLYEELHISFLNLGIASCIYNFELSKKNNYFYEMYDKLHNEIILQLDLLSIAEENIQYKEQYEKLKEVYEYKLVDYLYMKVLKQENDNSLFTCSQNIILPYFAEKLKKEKRITDGEIDGAAEIGIKNSVELRRTIEAKAGRKIEDISQIERRELERLEKKKVKTEIDKVKVIIYGAGKVGKEIYSVVKNNRKISLEGWVDKKYIQYQSFGYLVENPNVLLSLEFDYIIMASKESFLIDSMVQDITALGVDKNKLLYIC